jgi:excisionase family DNA binding protein
MSDGGRRGDLKCRSTARHDSFPLAFTTLARLCLAPLAPEYASYGLGRLDKLRYAQSGLQGLIRFDMPIITTDAKLNLTDYLTVGEAAEQLGVSRSTLRNWDKAGKLRPYRHPVNGYRLYLREELERLLGQIVKARG